MALVDFVNMLSEEHELLLLYLEENREAFALGTYKGKPEEFLFMFLKLE